MLVMGKKLAIKGHATRGKEVIELLKMMGGAPKASSGFRESCCYYISEYASTKYKYISWDYIGPEEIDKYEIFTLEEFLGKYPFKIGDKVIDKADGCPGIVNEMKWDEDVSDMKYFVAFGNDIDFGWFTNDSIEFCKETDTVKPVTNKNERTHEDVIFDSIIWHLRNSVNNGKQNLSGGECEDYFREVVKKNNENKMSACKKCGLHFGSVQCFDKDCPNNTPKDVDKSIFTIGPVMVPDKVDDKLEYEIIDGYEFDKIENGKIILKPIKFEYPTTYDECCDILNADEFVGYELMTNFPKLINARNAYWKIAGEELELAKPWEPAIQDTIWGITRSKDEIEKYSCHYGKTNLLEFPTEEMRDAFYENFKDLIEQCKELL